MAAWERVEYWKVGELHCVFLALCILFISITVVTVLFLCCSVTLSLSQPVSFAFSS